MKRQNPVSYHELGKTTFTGAQQPRLLNIAEEVALVKAFSRGRPFTEAEVTKVWKWAIDTRIRAMLLKAALEGKMGIHLRHDGKLFFAPAEPEKQSRNGLAPDYATEPKLEDFPPLTEAEQQEYIHLRDRWDAEKGHDSFTDAERSHYIELSDRAEVTALMVQSQKGSMTLDDVITGPAFEKPDRTFANDLEVAKWVKETVHRMECPSRLVPCDFLEPRIQSSLMLIAAFIVGADEARIANMLGLDQKLVCFWGENLRKAGVWLPDGKLDVQWFDPERGKMSFIADCTIAAGHVTRAGKNKDGLPTYKLANEK